nr:hypothetical protein [Flavobacteriaceae bacterium]
MENKQAPIFSEKYAITGTRIVIIFSAVFIFMKLFAIVSQGLWLLPNLLICLPALILGFLGYWFLKNKRAHIGFVVFALVVFVVVRLYEEQMQLYFYQVFHT